MKKEVIIELHQTFEHVAYEEDGVEYWLARDLQRLLGYTEWRNFLTVINKAKTACVNSKQDVLDHFVDVNKMVTIGSNAPREIDDIMLTRYACYLIAQNGDSRKEEIAFAQSYFAIQTRKQELIEERIALQERLQAREKLTSTEKDLSKTLYERGVNDRGFGIIRSKGDSALFGGYDTSAMKAKLGIPDGRPLADFLPTITIKAKDLAAEITSFNVKKNDLKGEARITHEHVKNNHDVRDLLAKSNIKPEELSPEEDIKKLEAKIKKADKESLKDIKKLNHKNKP